VQHGPTRTFLPASRQQTLQIPRGKTSSSLPRQTQKLHHSGIRLLGLSRDSLHKSTKYNPLLLVRDPQGRRTSSVSPATPRDRRVRYRYGRLPTGGVWLRQRLVVACLLAFYYGSTPAIRLYRSQGALSYSLACNYLRPFGKRSTGYPGRIENPFPSAR